MNHMTHHDHEQMNESNTGDDMSGCQAFTRATTVTLTRFAAI
jgi:hypothetical protein